jgi:hypothetical protein
MTEKQKKKKFKVMIKATPMLRSKEPLPLDLIALHSISTRLAVNNTLYFSVIG